MHAVHVCMSAVSGLMHPHSQNRHFIARNGRGDPGVCLPDDALTEAGVRSETMVWLLPLGDGLRVYLSPDGIAHDWGGDWRVLMAHGFTRQIVSMNGHGSLGVGVPAEVWRESDPVLGDAVAVVPLGDDRLDLVW